MNFLNMLAPAMGGGSGGGINPVGALTGIGMPGGPGSLGGPAVPPQLMSQIMPNANPQAAAGGGDPRIQALITALRGGGLGGSMGFGR